MAPKNIVVIGAGASGLAAACAAVQAGARVTLLEKNHVPGRKILSTGAGKCNLTNAQIDPSRYHTGTAGFINKTFKALPPAEILGFFKELGLLTVQEADGRVFPRSMRAAEVVDVMVNSLTRGNAELKVLTEATGVKRTREGFEVSARSVPPRWDKKAAPGPETVLEYDTVILAAGGPSYPQIGGSVSGYDLASSLGHTVKPPRPAIVPLKTKETFIRPLEGIKVRAAVGILACGKLLAETEGEVLFTKYGLSGPAILDLSRTAVFALKSGPVQCRLDLFPEYSEKDFHAFLDKRRAGMSDRFWGDFLCGMADMRVLQLISDLAKVGPDKLLTSVPERIFREFTRLLKGFELEISGPLDFDEAMVAAGGVETGRVSPATFESLNMKDLFITGELLDVDADSGGYNLHFAWTSGLLAGRRAAGL